MQQLLRGRKTDSRTEEMVTITRRQRNSETSETPNASTASSERSNLLKTTQQMFAKDLTDEELIFWGKFLSGFSLAEIRYAFENWNRNGRFFPKPKDIGDLAESYRLSVANQQFPIGCARCGWSGFYEVKGDRRPERVVAQCPCVKNVALREPYPDPHFGKGYHWNDMKWLFKRMQQEIAAGRKVNSDALLQELDSKREGGAPAWR
jgi:hypothetical protein